jgi:hypothetical protein
LNGLPESTARAVVDSVRPANHRGCFTWVEAVWRLFAHRLVQCHRNIADVDMVRSLSPQNLAAVEVGKDFMLSHGYIKHDFDVQAWAAPEFLQQAAKELLEERWKTVTGAKLPEATALRLG